jgi:hypothetical protein
MWSEFDRIIHIIVKRSKKKEEKKKEEKVFLFAVQSTNFNLTLHI